MNWSRRVRQAHRVLALLFTATVVVTVAVLALQGPEWVSYLPLPPLAVLLFSGLYLYVRHFVTGRRSAVVTRRIATPQAGPAPRVRRMHRWAAAAFTVTVLATFAALSLPDPVLWVSYLPLIPLALLLFSGLYLFVLPYRTTRSSIRAIDQRPAAA
ncbi:hypothetical protein [Nocardia jinanensis]|uniref:Uncharacterized protein n=1 Tax=Nocardia jinanensis TaxID=382504 RepID=A0A917RV39_9NOCA|nr:hypothetical protein [Nocardia jinanensis]GGL31128.1 hypothetical protein GCM10011588_52370 [Nocardia jinanensis]